MADFDPVAKAYDLDQEAMHCLLMPDTLQIEKRECVKNLREHVASLTQEQGQEIGKVIERYSPASDSPPHPALINAQIIFRDDIGSEVEGFSFGYGTQNSNPILTFIAPEELI